MTQPEPGLRHNAAVLGLAGLIEFGLQLLVPVLLARYLDEIAFAQYRLLWLLAGTVLAVAPMFMPQSLFYFFSRDGQPGKGRRVVVVVIFLFISGVVAGVLLSPFNPWLPAPVHLLMQQAEYLPSFFLALWVLASLIDILPMADGRAGWQAAVLICLAVLRTLLLTLAAVWSGEIWWIALAMLAFALIKILLIPIYLARYVGWKGLRFTQAEMREQFRYVLPFAIANALYLLRVQADQWVVVSMLSSAAYASFSVAAVVLPVATLVRQPLNHALLPRINRSFLAGARAEAGQLIAQANCAAVTLLIPIAGCIYVCAPYLVELLYTDRYASAAPVMQIYLLGMVFSAVAVGHMLSALNLGRYAMKISGVCLVLSLVLCAAGASVLGTTGAAAGTVLTLAIGELWALLTVARVLGMSTAALVPPARIMPPMFGAFAAVLVVQISDVASSVLADLSASTFGPWLALLINAALYVFVFTIVFVAVGGMTVMRQLVGTSFLPGRIRRKEKHEAA